MPIYTLISAGHAIVAFSARDYPHALGVSTDQLLRSELANLRTPDGAPLWDGKTEMRAREATADERNVWEADAEQAVLDGVVDSAEDALEGDHIVILIDYREPDEG